MLCGLAAMLCFLAAMLCSLAAMLCGLAELQRYVYEQLCSSQRHRSNKAVLASALQPLAHS